MNDDRKGQLPVILSFLDDARRLVEAGKVRGWEVFKWTVAINILLTTALFTQAKPTITPYVFPMMALVVSAMGGLLIHHYDHRLNSARKRALKLGAWLTTNMIDPYATMGETALIDPEKKDVLELSFFYLGIAATCVIALISVSLK